MKHHMMFRVMIHYNKIMILKKNQKIKHNIINKKNKMFNNSNKINISKKFNKNKK